METNFFKQMAGLDITGNMCLTIAKGAEKGLVVSVMLQNEQCGDNAKNLIPPFILRETAEKLDEVFFETITSPMEQTSSLLASMETYLKQVEEARKQSAMEKEKSEKERREKEAKAKKFDEAMAKADELEKDGKYREAWMKVPNPDDYPEKADEIRKRKSGLSGKFAPDLFDPPVQQEKPEAPKEGLYTGYPADEPEEETPFGNEEEDEY